MLVIELIKHKEAWLILTFISIFISCNVKSTLRTEVSTRPHRSCTIIIDTRDNNQYEVVRINDQVWFKSNLRYNAKGSKCYKNKKHNCKYGRLYGVTNLDSICPDGWRVPNLKDWNIIKAQYGEDSIHALLDTLNWIESSSHTNESGLSLKGHGYQFGKREFVGEHLATSIWLNQINKFDEYYHVHIYGGEGTYFEKSDYHTNEVLHAHPIENLENRRFSLRCICENPNELKID